MHDERPGQTLGQTLGLLAVLVIVLLACCGAAYAANLGGYLLDTKVNNQVVQPLRRSRLDADANYRRDIEAQARDILARYTAAKDKLPSDTQALAAWEKQNPSPWDFAQQQQYNNLSAQVQGDQGGEIQQAEAYNALVANPDNTGLFDFDPDLPPHLEVQP